MTAEMVDIENTDAASPPVTRIVGQWVAGLKFDDIPKQSIASAKRSLLDGIGCGLYGSRQTWCHIATDVAEENSSQGPCGVWGRDKRVGPIDAALVNGTAIHGFEIDDLHHDTALHPAAVIIPAVMALAEARELSGKDVLRAVVVGYEVGIRTALCSAPEHKLKGYHITPTNGTIGAAAAAASALGLNGEAAADALGIAVTEASGLDSARRGAMTKRLHGGLGARNGVLAGLLAEKGFTGAKDGLEVDFGGFFSTLSANSDLSVMTRDLGARWYIDDMGYKAYASCGSSHTTVDCVMKLMADGLSADNLEHMEVRVARAGFANIGWDYVPDGIASMQMNGRFIIATQLLKGNVFVDQFTEERLEEPEAMALLSRIDFIHDPEIDALGLEKRHTARVTATLKDGRVLKTSRAQRTGSAEYPLSQDDLVAKFRSTGGVVVAEKAIEIIVASIDTLEDAESLKALAALLTG
jgi:aconitate decarboxylase